MMDKDLQSKRDNLTQTILMALQKLAREAASDADPAEIIKDHDVSAYRATKEMALEARIKLHVEAWMEDAIACGRKFGELTVNATIKKGIGRSI